MNYTWTEGLDGEREQELFELYRQEWWTKDRNFDDVVHMLKHSDIVLGCCAEDGRLIGFARVLTYRTFKALIFDVIVHADFRSPGVGQAIVNRIGAHPGLAKVSSSTVRSALLLFMKKLVSCSGR